MGSGGSFQRPLRSSLVGLLTESLRGGCSAGIARVLKPVLEAVQAHALPLALRNLDRAWRSLTGDAPTIAPLYARALMLDGGDDEATLSVAQVAIDLAPDSHVAATRVLALLRLGRTAEALRSLETALAEYCVVPGDTLACVADEVMRHPAIEESGWVGLGVARIPTDFRLDGRAVNRGRRLDAWARVGWRPEQAPTLRVVDEHSACIELKTSGPTGPGWRWPFTINLDATTLRGDCFQVSALLPDGCWQALPDAPLLMKALAAPLPPRPPRPSSLPARPIPRPSSPFQRPVRPSQQPTRRLIDVIIPVYGNRQETLACIETASGTIDHRTRLLVVDDASQDPVLRKALDALAREGCIKLLRNVENLGFAGAVNRGMAYDPARDVVLLNSDTRVFGDWLERMRAAAYSDAAVGTVTPLSDNGSIASYPNRAGNPGIPIDTAATLHALAAATNAGRHVDLPVGVGFCLYIRRDCLNAVGDLDVAMFGKGYGEETDFCLRARQKGWTQRLAADVFVSHAGAQSFGSRRAALLDRSQRLLNLRHPGYDRCIVRFLDRDPVHAERRRLDEARLRAHAGRLVLIVTLALKGGVERFVKERCRQLRALGITPVLLRPAKPDDAGCCELSTDGLDLPNLRYDIPTELPALETLLQALSVEMIEIQHFLHLDARVIEAVRRLPVPHDVFIHDYAWLCPRVTLIDGSGRYCGEPAVKVCESCVKRHGSNLGETLSVKALRMRSSLWLRGARRIVAPSNDTADRIRRHFDGLDVEVRPHTAPALPGAAFSATPLPASRIKPHAQITRVALLGAIGAHKGFDILLNCARDARTRRLPLEFVVIGYTENDAPLLNTGKVFITGPYIDGEAPHLLARERPDLVWLPSVWPETWCYTLDYALAAHVPVAAFDLGAIAERLRATPHRLLLPLSIKSQRINDALLNFVDGAGVVAHAATNSVKSLPAPQHKMASIDKLQLRGMRMSKSTNGKTPAEGADAGLSASVQVLPLASGLYLFSVKAAKHAASTTDGQLSLPAMHVGLGPGVHSEQVEFMSSPSTHGAWLFSSTDQLVMRIGGSGATLVLTSVRAPTGDVLSIKVERLDSRIDVPEAVPAAATFPKQKPAVLPKPVDAPLSMQIATHVRARGDLKFVDAPWAGRVAPGLWIESFAVLPLEHLGAHDIEYKGLTGSGFETAWLSDNAACGTKGMSVPLVGFAMRLRPSTGAAGYDCEYSGYFQSGLTVGPLRNGAPCRSSVANDPLEGIQVRLVKRPGVMAAVKVVAGKAKMPPPAAVKPGKRVALAR